MKKALLFVAFAQALCFAQATFPIQIPGEAAVSVTLSGEAVPAVTAFIKASSVAVGAPTLTADITAAATTIPLSSTVGISTGNGCMIGSEVMLITAVGANSITVVRARIATTAASATSGALVTILRSGSYSVFIANVLADTIKNAMTSTPGPAVTAANAAIATQQGIITTALAAGTTHVP